MRAHSILSLLLLCWIGFASAQGDFQLSKYKNAIQAMWSSTAAGAATAGTNSPVFNPTTIRINVEYQQTSGLSATQLSELQLSSSRAVAVLQKYYQVNYPTIGNLLLQPMCEDDNAPDPFDQSYINSGKCSSVSPSLNPSAPASANACGAHGVFNSSHIAAYQSYKGGSGEPVDYYLYVTALYDDVCTPGGSLIAYAQACHLYYDATNQYLRPVAGAINVCPDALLPSSDDDYRIEVQTHELHHALGFSSSLWPIYGVGPNPRTDIFITNLLVNDTPAADGNPTPSSDMPTPAQAQSMSGASTTFSSGGTTFLVNNPISAIVEPSVVAFARAHFNCPTLSYVRLEDEGSAASKGLHWEYFAAEEELMTAAFPNGPDGSVSRITNLTLLLMNASGWYTPNFAAAGPLVWGLDSGCDFANSCQKYVQETSDPQYFCTPQTGTGAFAGQTPTGCSYNDDSVVQCTTDFTFVNGCPVNFTATGPSSRPSCEFTNSTEAIPYSQYLGSGSGSGYSCAVLTLTDSTDSSLSSGYCYPASCNAAGTTATFTINGKSVPCTSAGPVTIQSSSTQTLQFQCPDPATVCPSTTCPKDCNGRGQCINGACICRLMYQGADCSQNVTLQSNIAPGSGPSTTGTGTTAGSGSSRNTGNSSALASGSALLTVLLAIFAAALAMA